MSEETTRPVPTGIDAEGTPCAELRLSPTSNTERAECVVPPSTVVPIVFVPGVMGSNLKAIDRIKSGRKRYAEKNERVWSVETPTSPAGWLTARPDYRQAVLDHNAVMVDNSGKIGQGSNLAPISENSPNFAYQPTGQTPQAGIAFEEARVRGWGSPGWAFYGDFLDYLDYQLNQGRLRDDAPNGVFEQIMALVGTTPEGAHIEPTPLTVAQARKILDIHFPVYATGYNWLQSNLDSGRDIVEGIGHGNERVLGIKDIIKRHDGKNGQICKQVIVVTHSMGGLVARAAALKHGAQDMILGIVHGVLPIDGAAKFYKNLAAGFAGDTPGLMGSIMGRVLGATSRDAIAEIAYNPGPLELAPNKRYNGGKPWLFIKDRQGKTLAELPAYGDPYEEIYSDTTHVWRAVNPEWLDPLASMSDPIGRFIENVLIAGSYHDEVDGVGKGLHPQTYAHWCEDQEWPSWGELTWTSEPGRMINGPQFQRYWSSNQNSVSPETEQWSFAESVEARPQGRYATDPEQQTVRISIDGPSDPGDGTVPAAASGAQIAQYEGCQIACALTGFEHQNDYNSGNARQVLLDAIIRLVEPVEVTP